MADKYDVIVIGGGVSKHAHEFVPLIEVGTEIVSATLRNTAGIVGAAWLAANKETQPGLSRHPTSDQRVE